MNFFLWYLWQLNIWKPSLLPRPHQVRGGSSSGVRYAGPCPLYQGFSLPTVWPFKNASDPILSTPLNLHPCSHRITAYDLQWKYGKESRILWLKTNYCCLQDFLLEIGPPWVRLRSWKNSEELSKGQARRSTLKSSHLQSPSTLLIFLPVHSFYPLGSYLQLPKAVGLPGVFCYLFSFWVSYLCVGQTPTHAVM